ncbi:protein-glutamate methylesterase/protein-glutamine glutaminase [Massilibacterium senegalense]|uniref:protein-glutamate methylesterase/protein-glutamine glutaminase n=1 Tax=Massilibacterium senegalense TaxID=1632858 RepID=UPI0007829DB8|nr:chemotaxis response regulator protein-glutamate methylesterase [Massilibacterium senegalense]
MKIRVLVVDDSAFMRKLISDFLNEDRRIEVVGVAKNGNEALEKVQQLNPDVITLDIEMPVMDGLTALSKLMRTNPKPVVMLSSSTAEEADATFVAMQRGAIDFVAKPSGAISLDLYKVKEEVIEKVVSASKANIRQMVRQSSNVQSIKPSINVRASQKEQVEKKKDSKTLLHQIVCIGTSTGGPQALQEVITKFPKNLNAPVLVVQHMPPGFTKSLADRLNHLSQIPVKEAEDGEMLESGVVYIAKGAYHLKVKKINQNVKIVLDQSPLANGHRPAVDPMFASVAEELRDFNKVAVVMTGMGSDGAKGLQVLKNSGRLVAAIAESEKTSVVFGMPKAAIETGDVTEVVPLEKIAETISKYIR